MCSRILNRNCFFYLRNVVQLLRHNRILVIRFVTDTPGSSLFTVNDFIDEVNHCVLAILGMFTHLLPCLQRIRISDRVSRTVIGRTRHVTSPIWSCIDWLAGPKILIVGLSFAELETDKTVHLVEFNFVWEE